MKTFSMSDAPNLPSLVRAEQTLVRLPSRPHWIEPTVEFLRQKAVLCGVCQETRSRKLLLALQEALANAVIHGNLELSSELKEKGDSSFAEALAQRVGDSVLAGRVVDVLVEYDGRCCRWIITDQGKGFDVARAMQRLESDDPELLLASGRGILIMRSFLDEVKYDNGGRRLILAMNRESGMEKRQHERVESNQPIRIAPVLPDGSVDWDSAYEAVSLNFSEQGMGLLQERLATSDRIIIGINVDGQVVYLPAEVRHRRGIDGEVFELGCRFQNRAEVSSATATSLPRQIDPEKAVHRAVAQLMEKHQGPPLGFDERRLHPRVVFNGRLEIHHPRFAAPLVGFARDLSKGGMSFITTVALQDETVLVALPGGGNTPLKIRARIVRCNKVQDGFYDVGTRFLQLEDTPPGAGQET